MSDQQQAKKLKVTVVVTLENEDGQAVDMGLPFPVTVTLEDQVAIGLPADIMTLLSRATVTAGRRQIARGKDGIVAPGAAR